MTSYLAQAIPFLIIILASALFSYFKNNSRLSTLPGPPSPSLVAGHAIQLQLAKAGTLYPQWSQKYGYAYRIFGPFARRWLVMADPKGIAHVLNSPKFELIRSSQISNELWFGRSLFVVEGDEHRRMKRMLNLAFTPQSVKEVSHTFFHLANRLKSQWEETLHGRESHVFDITAALHMLSLDAISMTMLMHELSTTGSIPDLLHNLNNAPSGDMRTLLLRGFVTVFPILLKLPSPMKKWAELLHQELGAVAEKAWSESKLAMTGMDAKLLDIFSRKGEQLSKNEAVAHVISILFAGSESTANVISELFHEFAKNPKVQATLREELEEFERTKGRTPDYDDLMNPDILPYLDAVIRETLRLNPVLMDIRREAVQDDVIPLHFPVSGTNVHHVHVKAGQIVKIPVRDGINTDEGIWGPDGRDFVPERWLKDLPPNVALVRAQGHVLTFGDGSKVCLGRTFALAEMKIVISVIVRAFRFHTTDVALDFYHLGGDTVKPKVRGREGDGVQLPLRVSRV